MKREDIALYRQQGRLIPSAMYIRKSRAEEHLSLDETLEKHLKALTAYADTYGYLVRAEDIYREVVSGESLFGRPQMLKLMEAVSAGKYQAVLCIDMQRLGRGGMYDQGFILDTFRNSETLIVTPERIYDLTQSMDEEAAEMQTFLSRSEYRMITKRLRRGTMQAIENGAYMANAPFGYRKIRKNRMSTLEIIPEEAACVRMIYEMYADGTGCTLIARTMTQMGYHGRRGSSFSRATVKAILTNPVYIGKIRWNRTTTVKSGIGADRSLRVQYNQPEQWRIIDAPHEAIIAPELWDKVQEISASRYRLIDNKHVASPLAGLVFCGKCGAKMNMMGQSKKVPYLLCPTKGCTAGAKYEYVEQALLLQLGERFEGLKIELQSEEPPDLSKLDAYVGKMRERLVKLDTRRGRMYSLLEDGVYSREVFAQRMELLTKEAQQLKSAITEAEAEITAALAINKRRQIQQIETVLSGYQSASLAARKEMLHLVIEKIIYFKEKKTKPADFEIFISFR